MSEASLDTLRIVLVDGPMDGRTLDGVAADLPVVLYRHQGSLYLYRGTGTTTAKKPRRVIYQYGGRIAVTAQVLFVRLYGVPQGEAAKPSQPEKEGPL